MSKKTLKILGWIVVIAVLSAILAVRMAEIYDCCIDAGYDRQRCLYETLSGNYDF